MMGPRKWDGRWERDRACFQAGACKWLNHLKPTLRPGRAARQSARQTTGLNFLQGDQQGPRHWGRVGRGRRAGAGPSWPRSHSGGAGNRSLARGGTGARLGRGRHFSGRVSPGWGGAESGAVPPAGGTRLRVRALTSGLRSGRLLFLTQMGQWPAPPCPPSGDLTPRPLEGRRRWGPAAWMKSSGLNGQGGRCATAGGVDRRATGKSEGRGWAGATDRTRGTSQGRASHR